MILIGQYDSPFVRRVAITLKIYGLAYDHRPWSVWGDAEKIGTPEAEGGGGESPRKMGLKSVMAQTCVSV